MNALDRQDSSLKPQQWLPALAEQHEFLAQAKGAQDHLQHAVQASLQAKKEFFERQASDVVRLAALMAKVFKQGGRVLIFGNGGSAADAQHMAAEMVGRMLMERKKPLAAVALTTDTSNLTAIANDYSYDDIFSLQVKALGRPGDLALGISTSGNSKNVVKAIEAAKSLGLFTASFTGAQGGLLKQICDLNLNVALGQHSSMIQETHIAVIHGVVDVMDRFFLGDEYVKPKGSQS